MQKKQKPKKKSNPKGFGPSLPATDEQQAMVLKKKTKIQKKIKKEFPGTFKALSYRRTVAGHTDEIVIDVGPDFEGKQVKITVVQKANGGYLLWNADWHTPEEEVEVGQLEVQPEVAPEDNTIEGTPRVMKRQQSEAEEGAAVNKASKIVEMMEKTDVSVVESAPPPPAMNGPPARQPMKVDIIQKPKKSKKPMIIQMGRPPAPEPQIVQEVIQPVHIAHPPPKEEEVYQPQQTFQEYSAPPRPQIYQEFQAPQPQVMVQQQSSGPNLLHVTVIDGGYEPLLAHRQPANEKTYHPRQQAQTFAPHVLFVKTVNPF